MTKLELYYPVSPHKTNQAWGIYNPSYQQFGFARHNGIDLNLVNGQPIYAPLDATVVRVGNQPNGGGIFIGLLSGVCDFSDGKQAQVLIDFLHCKEIVAKEGSEVKTGDMIALGDNTGFSTGPHTHMQCRRVVNVNGTLVNVDTNDANNSFDHSLYWNGYYATDKPILLKIISLLQNFLEKLKGRNLT